MGIYFDNAATSWPKPKGVLRAMEKYFYTCGGNPGRSGHKKAIEAGRIVLRAREVLGELFSIKDPGRILFTKNATEGLNIILFGLLQPGDHLVTTSMEHNSVLRPVNVLVKRGIRVTVIEGDVQGIINPADIGTAIEEKTKLVCINHASNVTGTIQDIDAAARICNEKNVLILVDAAQTAGVIPIDCENLGIDFLAASGHKGLLGPQGTGILYVKGGPPSPLIYGGTGSLSDLEEQPGFFPDVLESGTLNVIGIAGLAAGVEYILNRGIGNIREHELRLIGKFIDELRSVDGIKIYGPEDIQKRTGVVSLSLDGLYSSTVGEELDSRYDIQTRIGLHCAPRAHKTIDTFPHGTVRFGIGPFTKKGEILAAVRAVRDIADGRKSTN